MTAAGAGAAVAAALAALAVAGCGGSSGASGTTATTPAKRTVNDSQVEQGIKQDLSTSSVTVSSVKCPAGVPVQPGGTFTCTVAFSNDATGKVTVTQKGANQYTYTLKSGSVQIPGTSVADSLEKQLAKQGFPNAAVTCPDTIIVKVGTTVTCDVAGAGGGAGTVTFTFSSADGSISPSSVQTG